MAPLACGAVPVRRGHEIYRALRSPLRCLELRLDYLEVGLSEVRAALERAASERVVIFTVRRREEGGAWRGSEEERAELYARLVELRPSYIDVEVDSPIARRVASLRERGVRLIASKHDFSGTPPLETLVEWARKAAEIGDVVKVVTYAREPRDGLRVLSIIGAVDKPTVAFAMGPAGVYTRVAAAVLGSPIVYVSLDEATAPGQIPAGAYYAALLGLGVAPEGEGLDAMREAIDWVDSALVHLLQRRLEICREIGKLKRAAGIPLHDDAREGSVLERASPFRQLFEIAVQMCKAVQLVA
ncbi:MAG: type I 3-dehydroquinate dehydratase [Thermoproteaceae archaeon]|nr:type I 3-dehydroquinate dehydratase [Thermoproteaceae archaeon]